MAYGFEQKQAKNDPDVELYLDEGMLFEAWIMIIRHWTGDYDELWEKLEAEMMKKSTKLTVDEMDSLSIEWSDYERANRYEEEAEAWIGGGN